MSPWAAGLGVALLAAAAPRAAASSWHPRPPEFAALPAGTPLLPADPVAGLVAGFQAAAGAHVHLVDAPGLPSARAARVSTRRRPETSYSVQLSIKTVKAVRRGDALLARFYVRAPDLLRPSARLEFVFERAGGDYSKSVLMPVKAGPDWQRVDVPFRAADSLRAGGAHANFRLGFSSQTIDIAGFELLRLDSDAALSDVRGHRPSYAERSRDAAWRAEAERRIERFRKAELVVEALDGAGRPLPHAQVEVRMTRHAFAFGAAVSARYLQTGAETPNKRRYRAEILRLFNSAVVDNALKWSQWEQQWQWGAAAVGWLRGHGLAVRGHNLVWPGWDHLPAALRPLAKRPGALAREVDNRIITAAGRLRGQIDEWDVVNEPLDNADLAGVLGAEALDRWLTLARRSDPSARLFVNEAGILNRYAEDAARQDALEALLRGLLRRGAPLDGVGLQAHFDLRLTEPSRLLAVLDRFARLGKPLVVTEFDIDVPDEALRADYLRDFMTACFSHPGVSGILVWQFWQGLESGNPAASVLYDADWTLKPSGRAWMELVFGRWWTRADGRTDARGSFRARGFLGRYEIEVRAPGYHMMRVVHDLGPQGARVRLPMTPEGK